MFIWLVVGTILADETTQTSRRSEACEWGDRDFSLGVKHWQHEVVILFYPWRKIFFL